MNLAIKTVTFVAAVMPICAFAATSTFHQSCSGIKLSTDGTTIEAGCWKRDRKTSVNTSLRLKGIVNIDGKLTMVRGAQSNHDKSCDTFVLYLPAREKSSTQEPQLSAICKTNSQKRSRSILNLTGIENIDGTLRQR